MKSNEFPTHVFVRRASFFWFCCVSRLRWIPAFCRAEGGCAPPTCPPPRAALFGFGLEAQTKGVVKIADGQLDGRHHLKTRRWWAVPTEGRIGSAPPTTDDPRRKFGGQ